jgi:hypothetical protein
MAPDRCLGSWIILAAFLCATPAHGQEISEPKPVWRTDLRQAGLVPQSFQFCSSVHPIYSICGLAFGRDGHILPAFSIAGIKGKEAASLTRHLISLDAATGTIRASRTSPSPEPTLGRLHAGVTAEGNFVVLQDDALCVYSPDLQEIDRVDLPADPKYSSSSWELLIPPGGNLIFLQHGLNGSQSLRMLTTSPLREVRYWDKSEYLSSPSEKYFAKVGEHNVL